MAKIVCGVRVRSLRGVPAAVLLRDDEARDYRARFVEAVADGLVDADVGRIIDGEQAVEGLLAEIRSRVAPSITARGPAAR